MAQFTYFEIVLSAEIGFDSIRSLFYSGTVMMTHI